MLLKLQINNQLSFGAIWTQKRPKASRGMPWSVGFEISQAWSANPPQMAPDRQIKEMTVMAGSSYLLMDCWWWQSPPHSSHI